MMGNYSTSLRTPRFLRGVAIQGLYMDRHGQALRGLAMTSAELLNSRILKE